MKLHSLSNLNDLAEIAKNKKVSSKQILTVSVNDVISKTQVRKRFSNIEELGDSILSEGQQSAIIVSPINRDGKYTIQKGERRWRACKLKNIHTINIVVNEQKQSDVEATAGELIENIQRDDLTAIEIANGLQSFIDAGWKQADIAKRIAKSLSFVSTHLSLLKLPPCVKNLYDEEITSDTETLNNLRLLFNLNKERCIKVCKNAESNSSMTRKQSRDFLVKEKNLVAEANIEKADNVTTQQKKWGSVSPKNLLIKVNVLVNGNIYDATLITNRISLSNQNVWVSYLNEKNEISEVEVDVSNIELLSVSSK